MLSQETCRGLKFILKCKWLPLAPKRHTGLGRRVIPGTGTWWEGVSGMGVGWGGRDTWPGQSKHWQVSACFFLASPPTPVLFRGKSPPEEPKKLKMLQGDTREGFPGEWGQTPGSVTG